MRKDRTGRLQVFAGHDYSGQPSPALRVTLNGVTLVYAWVRRDGNLIVLESAYSLQHGHEVVSRSPEWLADLMGWPMPQPQRAAA